MSSEDFILALDGVWKKYSKDLIFHRSFREDAMNLFASGPGGQELLKNEFWALKDIRFTARRGQIIGLWGHNGAGKSTILKLLSRITYPTLGNVHVRGSVAPILEIGTGFHPDLTGRENIFFYAALLGMTIRQTRALVPTIIGFAEVDEFIDMPTRKYSSGMYLRLAFSIAIHCQTDIFLIDEVLMMGDTSFQKKCTEKILELKNKNRTVVLATHNRAWMEALADDLVALEHGQIKPQESRTNG